MATEAQRQHVIEVIDFMHKHASHLAYPPGDERTNRDDVSWHLTEQHMKTILEHGGIWQGDCSEFGSYVLKKANLWPWSSPGWTGSHLKLLPHHYTDGKQANPGALVIFGEGEGKHEAVVHTKDHHHGDPVCASHGRPGLQMERVSVIAHSIGGGVRYLSIAHL